MKRFFKSLECLHHFTTQLHIHRDSLLCPHCSHSEYLVSHGFTHKIVNGDALRTGKRLLCSNRYGRLGCGRTLPLHCALHVPGYQYSAIHFTVFIVCLCAGSAISKAYKVATQAEEPRHAYRWLSKLKCQLPCFRQQLLKAIPVFSEPPDLCSLRRFPSRPLAFLLPSLQQLISILTPDIAYQFQWRFQQVFL